MDTTAPATLASLDGLTLEQIANLPLLPLIGRILPERETVPVAAFQSAI